MLHTGPERTPRRPGLVRRIKDRIEREKSIDAFGRRAKVGLVLCAGAALFFVVAVSVARNIWPESEFAAYVSLFFSDPASVALNARAFLLSVLESISLPWAVLLLGGVYMFAQSVRFVMLSYASVRELRRARHA